jgi:DNA-binding transcriptional LysR family regulator
MRSRHTNSFGELNAFLAVVNCGNFSAAARELGLPPSSISRRISAIETRLGAVLFKRTTREVILTEAGTSYASSVERIMNDLYEADLAASRFSSVPEGTLRIESRPGLCACLLAPLLPKFVAAYPMIEVDLRLTDKTLESLKPGSDVGFRYGLGAPSSLVTRKIMTTRQGTYASPIYLQKYGTPNTPDDLVHHNCVAFSFDDNIVNWRYRLGSYDRVMTVSGNLRSNDVSTIALATDDGLGISVAHTWVMEKLLREGRVVNVLQDYEVSTMDTFDLHVSAVYAPAMKNVKKVRVLIDFMLQSLRSQQGGIDLDQPPYYPTDE